MIIRRWSEMYELVDRLTLRPTLQRVYAEPGQRRSRDKYTGFSLLAELANLAEVKTGHQRIVPLTYRPFHPEAMALWDEVLRVTTADLTEEDLAFLDPDRMDQGIAKLLNYMVHGRKLSDPILAMLPKWEIEIQRVIHEVAATRGTPLSCDCCGARWIREEHTGPVARSYGAWCQRPAVIEISDSPDYRHTRCQACGEFVWWPKGRVAS